MKTILYMAITPNGFVAGEKDDTLWLGNSDWPAFVRMAKKAGNVVFGRRTFEALMKEKNFPVPGVLNIVMTHQKKLLGKGKWNHVVFTDESVRGVIEHVREKGYKTLLIGGGGKISASFLEAGLIDELFLDMKPVILHKGIKLFESMKKLPSGKVKLELIGMQQTSKNQIQLHYKVKKK